VLEELEGLRELLEEVAAGQKLLLGEVKLVLAKLDELLEMQRKVLELPSARPITAPAAPPAAEPSDEELPDFLRDNPWLSVLRSRGGGE
jgi:hypothetical protein